MKVQSSKGGMVDVQIYGVSDVVQMLAKKQSELLDQANAGLIQASNFVQSEVQESIIGNRNEPRSVDTGELANSISVEILDKETAQVYTNVPQGAFMEYGTSQGIQPRRHFQNTASRTKDKVKEIFEQKIK